jgi:hypothetical protein
MVADGIDDFVAPRAERSPSSVSRHAAPETNAAMT